VNVLVIGAGRMGKRHLRGLEAAGLVAVAVDPRAEADADFVSVEEALAGGNYDAAILAETAAGRLERFRTLVDAGIGRLLVEKPIEQSRARMHELVAIASDNAVDARVNHFFRTQSLFRDLRGAPFSMTVSGGAFGLACNGIHWLDLALYLSEDAGGELLYGELDEIPIGSGRGTEFRDYGGRALYAFGASRLYLNSMATSSAPMHAVIDQRNRQTILLPHDERAIVTERDPGVDLPAYRYGAGYATRTVAALESDDLWRSTERWARGSDEHPTLERSSTAHDLLFDLLETTGDDEFPIT
jgi:hypothetical protein